MRSNFFDSVINKIFLSIVFFVLSWIINTSYRKFWKNLYKHYYLLVRKNALISKSYITFPVQYALKNFFLKVAFWKQREYMNASPCLCKAIWFVYFYFYCLRKALWFVHFIVHNIKIVIWCLNYRKFPERISLCFTVAKITKTSQETRSFVRADVLFLFQTLEVLFWNIRSF